MNTPPSLLHDIPHIRAGLDALIADDPVFKNLSINFQDFNWPCLGPGFDGLVRIVLGQQVSTKAAQALWLRLSESGAPVTPEGLLSMPEESLRALGISRQKAGYIRGLAMAVEEGRLNLAALAVQDDEAVYETITALKGFGRWSAEMYLMFGLARPDIWPVGDLGIRMGMQSYLEEESRPDETVIRKEGERFRPHRTAASLLLWHMKARSG